MRLFLNINKHIFTVPESSHCLSLSFCTLYAVCTIQYKENIIYFILYKCIFDLYLNNLNMFLWLSGRALC